MAMKKCKRCGGQGFMGWKELGQKDCGIWQKIICSHCNGTVRSQLKKMEAKMRGIKVRAWDNKVGVMMGSWTIQAMYSWTSSETCSPKDVIFMQYIGWEDKRGREVCEGDIIKWEKYGYGYEKDKCSKCGHIPLVDKFFEVRIKSGHTVYHIEDYYLEERDGKNIEVVGNIRENPELLKE